MTGGNTVSKIRFTCSSLLSYYPHSVTQSTFHHMDNPKPCIFMGYCKSILLVKRQDNLLECSKIAFSCFFNLLCIIGRIIEARMKYCLIRILNQIIPIRLPQQIAGILHTMGDLKQLFCISLEHLYNLLINLQKGLLQQIFFAIIITVDIGLS